MRGFYQKHYRYILIFIILLSFFTLIDIPIEYDDKAYLEYTANIDPITFAINQYLLWSGRFLIEMGMDFFPAHLFIFKIVMSLMIMMSIYAIETIFKVKNNFIPIAMSLICLSFTLKLGYLDAGFIATNFNYFVLFSLLLIGLINFFNIYQDAQKSFNVWQIICLLISFSSEQCIAVFVGIYLFFNILYFLKNKQINKKLLCFCLPLIVMLIVYFLAPGPKNRAQIEMQYVPQYADYGLIKRIVIGIAYFFNYEVIKKIILILCIVLGNLNLYKKNYFGLLINIASVVIFKFFIPQYLLLPSIEEMPYAKELILCSLISMILIIINFLVTTKQKRLIITWFLLLAFGSKIMLGLSPTYYRSGLRTFDMFFLIVGIMLIYTYVINTKDES